MGTSHHGRRWTAIARLMSVVLTAAAVTALLPSSGAVADDGVSAWLSRVAAVGNSADAHTVSDELKTIFSSPEAASLVAYSPIGTTLTRVIDDNSAYVVTEQAAAAYRDQIVAALTGRSEFPLSGDPAGDDVITQLNAVVASPEYAAATNALSEVLEEPQAVTYFASRLTDLIQRGAMVPSDLTDLFAIDMIPFSRLAVALGFDVFGLLAGAVSVATGIAAGVCIALEPCGAVALGVIGATGSVIMGELGLAAALYDRNTSPQGCAASANTPVFQGGGQVYFSGSVNCSASVSSLSVYVGEVDNGTERASTGTGCSNCSSVSVSIQTYSMPQGCYQSNAYFVSYSNGATTTGNTVYSQMRCGQP